MASVPPLLLVGTAVLCLGNLLHIIGIGTVHWTDFRPYGGNDLDIGLFRVCSAVAGCQDLFEPSHLVWLAPVELTDAMQAVRALVIIGMLGGLLSGAIAILFTLFKLLSKSVPKILTIICALAALGAFGLIIIGVIVYAAVVCDDLLGDRGYSFGLSIVGGILLAAGGSLVFLGGRSVD